MLSSLLTLLIVSRQVNPTLGSWGTLAIIFSIAPVGCFIGGRFRFAARMFIGILAGYVLISCYFLDNPALTYPSQSCYNSSHNSNIQIVYYSSSTHHIGHFGHHCYCRFPNPGFLPLSHGNGRQRGRVPSHSRNRHFLPFGFHRRPRFIRLR